MTRRESFDQTWEREVYSAGKQLNRYPYDDVVTFMFRRSSPAPASVLEIGSGPGNNLWFVEREGWTGHGVDAAPSSVIHAARRLGAEGLSARLAVADFTQLPFRDASFSTILDRAALTCAGQSVAAVALRECARVARARGSLLFTPYSAAHSSTSFGRDAGDGVVSHITRGLVGVGAIAFYDESDISRTLGAAWEIDDLQHVVRQGSDGWRHAHWHVEAKRRPRRS